MSPEHSHRCTVVLTVALILEKELNRITATLSVNFRLLLLKVGKLLVRLAMDAELRSQLTVIYARLDVEMPNLLKELKPSQMTGSIASAIRDATGQKATIDRIIAVATLYNPIAATVRNLYR